MYNKNIKNINIKILKKVLKEIERERD